MGESDREAEIRAAQAALRTALDAGDDGAMEAALARLTALVPPPVRPDPDPAIEAAYRQHDAARAAEEAAHRRWWRDVESRFGRITIAIGLSDGTTTSDPEVIRQYEAERRASLLGGWEEARAASEAAWERLFELIQARAAERRARAPELATLVDDLAAALAAADAHRPPPEPGHHPGIGQLGEREVLRLLADELRQAHPERYREIKLDVRYPGAPRRRTTCDLVVGEGPAWAIEIALARLYGEDGTPDPTTIKEILLPFGTPRSAVAACERLASAGFPGRAAIVICGFENPDHPGGYPLPAIIAAFEALAGARVTLGPRHEANLGELVHPVHHTGRVFAWEVMK